MQTTVVLPKAATYDQRVVSQGMSEFFAGLGGYIRPGKRVLIKPNIPEGLPPERAVTTHPVVLKAVVSFSIIIRYAPGNLISYMILHESSIW